MSVEGERDGDDDEHTRAEEPRERGTLSNDRAPVAHIGAFAAVPDPRPPP